MPIDSKFDKHFFAVRDKLIRFGFGSYYKIKTFFYYQNFRKKHLSFFWSGGKLQIISTDHEDYIAAAQKKLDKISKKYQRKKFIELALKEALEGCNFIIFSPPEDDNKFVQFWTGEHTLKYNFYANNTNKLKKYFLSIIGLLSEMGFVNSQIDQYKGSMVFKIDKGEDYISVDANFYKDYDLAVEFTEIIYKQIYKSKTGKLIAKVE